MRPPHFPTPLGVIRKVQLPSYDELLNEQIEVSKPKRKKSKVRQSELRNPRRGSRK